MTTSGPTFDVSSVEVHAEGSFGYGVDDGGVLRCIRLGDAEALAIDRAFEEGGHPSVTVRDPRFVERERD
jgi:hypothetical protein